MSLCNSILKSHRTLLKDFGNGGRRIVSPTQTLERWRPLSPRMGITRVANITGLDSIGIPVVSAFRPNSRSVAVSNGKGLDLPSAEASAVMEAAESYHAERITLPLKLGSRVDLASSHRLLNVDAAPKCAGSLYHPDWPLLWIEGHDLMLEENVWLPYELVHTNYTLPLPQGSGCFVMSSNGLASGNHLLEAISHGICEVVERDATTLWNLSGREAQLRTRLDLNVIDHPGCREVLAKYERAGINVAVYDTTSDIGLPSFFCAIADSEETSIGTFASASGMGCHPAREVALLRALTEAAQSRLTVIAGARDDIFAEDYDNLRSPQAIRRSRFWIENGSPSRKLENVLTWERTTVEEDIDTELERLRSAGFEQVVVVDISRHDLGIPVARVVIPGLEYSISANYTPGARAHARLGAKT